MLGLLPATALALMQAPEPTPPSATDEVVVTGQADAIEKFVEGLTVAGKYDQVSRWHDEVCPRFLGLPPASASFLTERLAATASRSRVPIAGATCTPNLFIAFTSEADEAARALSGRHTNLFRDATWGAVDRARVARWRRPAPVRFVHLTRSASAREKAIRANGKVRRLSALSSASIRGISAAVMIVDTHRLSGTTWGQLADYLAMAAFTRADPDGTDAESIMSLFSSAVGERPTGLTARDVAFIQALYDTSPIARSAKQRRQIRDSMTRRLEGDPADGAAESAPDQRE